MEKHHPREEIQEKEMVVLSEKGKEISIKTEVTSSSMKSFEDRPIEHEEEASKGKYEVIGTDIEMEHEEMDTEDEEHEVRRLTKEKLEIYHQYKEFYTIQAKEDMKRNPRLTLPEDPNINIWNYYSMMKVTPIIMENFLLVILTIPLADQSLVMNLYKVHNMPTLHPGLHVQFEYQLEGEYLAITRDKQYAALPTA